MAESVTCPTCGARNRVGSPMPDTVTCGRCGRSLNTAVSSGGSVAPPPRSRRGGGGEAASPSAPPSAVSSGGDAPPAPRRRRRGAEAEPAAAAGRGGPDTAVLDAGPPRGSKAVPVTIAAPVEPGAPARSAKSSSGGAGSRGYEPSRLVRVLAWAVALPIALVAVGIPARKAGYLNSQRLLDVIVKHHLGRFVPLVVIVALWALVTAVLVTVFLEAARRLRSDRGDGGNAPAMAAPNGGGSGRRRR